MDNSGSPNQLDISDASSKNIEDQPASPNPEDIEPPVEGHFHPNVEPEQTYGCKYCPMNFSSKQALGGHYNAHKTERASEKAARESHDLRLSLHGAGGMANPNPFLGSYVRSGYFGDRSVFNNLPYNAPQQHGIHMIGINARPRLPLTGIPYVPARPVPGLSNVYPGWVAPGPRVLPFQGQGGYGAQNPGANIWFPNVGAADGSSSSRPVDLSIFAAPNQQDEDESGLDLSLRLNQQYEDESGLDLSLKL